ncbi:MAG TPA: FAD-dependent oxidoreductase, partial [Paludibacter sp.]
SPQKTQSYDFVVVGGGVAGMCAAVAAARLGCKVALIHNRPVLGGNNSSDVRVHLGGSIELGQNKGLGRIIREFGHSREGNAKPADVYEDEKKLQFVLKEANVTLLLNYQAVSVKKEGSKIESVIARNLETSEEICFSAPIFSDCTGDGTIGYLAGADYRMGRESKAEFGEYLAPEVADKMTMGASVQWYSTNKDKEIEFPEFRHGVNFNAANCEKATMGEWKWETGMNLDQVKDIERIRDYGMMVVFSNWSFLKNELKDNQKFKNRELSWVAYIAGKRESRRLLGDYILKQDDIDKNVFHEDASFTTSWSIDLHTPDTANSKKFPGAEFKAQTRHVRIYPYSAPYRCLYSRNVDNLFMAGRNISVTHVALGTVRVMRTTGMMGEVVGIAASLCKKHNATPRLVYQLHLEELKQLMSEGVGKKEGIPNNQKFNEQEALDAPRVTQ